jgi:ankyrin repeat protein
LAQRVYLHPRQDIKPFQHRGREAVVALLLKKGAHDNAQGDGYGNALQAASLGGYRAVVALLIEKEADINAQVGKYGNALADRLNAH